MTPPPITVLHNHEKRELSSVGRGLEEDLYGSLYDNIFLRGHIGRSPNLSKRVNFNKDLVFLSGRGASSGPGQTTICSRIPRTLSLETSFSRDLFLSRLKICKKPPPLSFHIEMTERKEANISELN